jgi:hypothetical protein
VRGVWIRWATVSLTVELCHGVSVLLDVSGLKKCIKPASYADTDLVIYIFMISFDYLLIEGAIIN